MHTLCRLCKIHPARFFLDHGAFGGRIFVLWLGLQGSGQKSGNGFLQKGRAHYGQAVKKRTGRLIFIDRGFPFKKDGPRIQARLGEHGRYPRNLFPIDNGPLNGSCPTIFW
ncbi:hypothetical protein SDC9_191145 [bioreactor metagenome]|uniref:Uncharacterized protein n=1 Tax=bioreactor metagenome TaxID=1076179 RepID=A0A645HX25_9ZZZZ